MQVPHAPRRIEIPRSRRYSRAEPMPRALLAEVLVYPSCHGRRRVLAGIFEADAIRRSCCTLARPALGHGTFAPPPSGTSRTGPPQHRVSHARDVCRTVTLGLSPDAPELAPRLPPSGRADLLTRTPHGGRPARGPGEAACALPTQRVRRSPAAASSSLRGDAGPPSPHCQARASHGLPN